MPRLVHVNIFSDLQKLVERKSIWSETSRQDHSNVDVHVFLRA
jgi:hypothetical protein